MTKAPLSNTASELALTGLDGSMIGATESISVPSGEWMRSRFSNESYTHRLPSGPTAMPAT